MQTISLIVGVIIAILMAGGINVVRHYFAKIKEENDLKEVKTKAEQDGVITKEEKALINKELKELKEAKKAFFKSLLTFASAMFKIKINKKASVSDLIDKVNEKIK